MQIQYKILDSRIQNYIPKYATSCSAGLDLHALLDAPLTLEPNQSVLILTGLAIFIGDPNYMALIFPRSGLGHKHGIVLGNGTGVIDADYQGELKISLWNRSHQSYTVQPFERVAQMVITPIIQAQLTLVDDFIISQRATGGFGSTGQ
jgi:dUTP pyrophosphatase